VTNRGAIDLYRSHCRARQPYWLQLLERLVNQDSGAGDSPGISEAAELVRLELVKLGFDITSMPVGEPETPLLIARNKVASSAVVPRIAMLGHVDTVFPRGTATERPFKLDADCAYGPGVADMKGGIVVMLGMLDALRESGVLEALMVTVVINGDEESGSVGSRSSIEGVARQSDLSLVFEPGRPDGSFVVERRGLQRYRLEVKGRAAHTGVDPQRGASAIDALSRKVLALHELTDPSRNLTVSVGVMRGGSRPNVIADHAVAEVDVRVADMDTYTWVSEAIIEIAGREDVPGTTGSAALYAERPPMSRDDRIESLGGLYGDCAVAFGEEFRMTATGGGSDGNFTGALGIPTLDGLGPVGDGYHSSREFVRIETLESRMAISAAVMGIVSETGLPWTEAGIQPRQAPAGAER
jgi:glutamate carboxypeptidase